MNKKWKPSAFPAFGIRGAKVLPYRQLPKKNMNYLFKIKPENIKHI